MICNEKLIEANQEIEDLNTEVNSTYFLYSLSTRALELKLTKEELVQCIEVAMYLSLSMESSGFEVEEICRENIHKYRETMDIDKFIASVIVEQKPKYYYLVMPDKYDFKYTIKRSKTAVTVKTKYKDKFGSTYTKKREFSILQGD